MHPLDVNPSTAFNSSMCVGGFVPQDVAVGKDVYVLILVKYESQ